MVGGDGEEPGLQRQAKRALGDPLPLDNGMESEAPNDFSNDPSDNISVQSLQVACVQKCCLCTIVAPLDRIKFVMQCQKELQRTGVLDRTFRSSWHCFRCIHSIEGIRSFWRGNLVQVGSLLPVTAAHMLLGGPMQMWVYNNFPRAFPFGHSAATYASILCGALAVSAVSYPLEFARFRLAVDLRRSPCDLYDYRHSLAFFAQSVFSEAPHLLYAGFGLYVTGSIIYGVMYTGLTQQVLSRLPSEPEGYTATVVQVGAGVGVSAVSTLGLHPLDTMRRRMMIAVTMDGLRYASARHCFHHILSTEGIAGFYRGAAFTMVRMVYISSLYMWFLPAA
ncbi:ADP/ATP mitochondrial translocase, putative [Trypanosoma brucei gambiense DAL972]|uniref:ADP/ATP translocase n=1 Tax=Trypanosoma brucei gambiense (strain MHOM/CI/86/DAL972) TaxID=679716 RepID=C9ZUP8_TRYB9|nr:ADP/ATP mitochondrial translocase, putative [Trypanosoma brucei gambiense DAL972]CBH13136.1 ADP/ATP mitochondrial translocase, putative [Trypanosoma brucei gambiense DAL972]|eukprot:XP_011775413.1 ADP/ATP mitochondrial translocase, putative [Trypanosoma brucei gambiense DAL972]